MEYEEMDAQIVDFYENCAEAGRLERRLGIIEFYRTKEILGQYLQQGSVIYDVGGGIGMYARWLAAQGHQVHLLELAGAQVDYAREYMMAAGTVGGTEVQNPDGVKFAAETADARKLPRPDESADVVLLMGPLYHLQKKEDRMLALSEARRVLKKGGLLAAAGIPKYSSATWALSTYSDGNDFFEDDVYFRMLQEEITTGNHNRPEEYCRLVAQAYFHTAEGMEQEVEEAGFRVLATHAVEGCIWFTPNLNENWERPEIREKLLEILNLTEKDRELIGMSPHFLTMAVKE